MIEEIRQFQTGDFYTALQNLFKTLKVPVNYITEEPATPGDILGELYKPDRSSCKLMDDVYFLGMVDDAAFEGVKSLDPAKIESDYDGILIFGVTLHARENGLLPTRGQLAEITRSFNRKFHYTPVVVVFKYENHIAFANAERLKYKQEWREGEKAGKVSLLRNIDIDNPHSGHMRILLGLIIKTTGPKAIKTFAGLYSYWQEVFNVSLLNKKFYEELSNWYFWAVKEVAFPSEPTIHSLFEETGSNDEKKLTELIQEHKAKNVIRLLTRFLFVWFIKEKKLIPEELFDPEYLKRELLNNLAPYNEGELFKSINIKSHYYKAVLQNLFFATLNQEMGKRGFRKDGQNMNVTNLLRYESCFKNTQKFVDLVESIVPFMNGGLFECLDKPHSTKKGPKGGDVIIYKDGFSDRKDNDLKVPDYLFFGHPEDIDLSSEYGSKAKKYKQAAVKGLINIFNSYKFTIAENTPIEEDVALDPELLGKVFENLLASYNPETKTTARKQTGSFYTPREIVNYMVDESLIAYLKNEVDWALTKETEEEQDTKLHELLSFDPINPFADNLKLQKEIIKALDHCTILDPACGSGAFPMGILQKMVHILQKLDPENDRWRELQMEKAISETESALHLDDKGAREQKLVEINEAFDQQINDPDYARKLFLIENCIYGVDIQPIAVQISKLRFFISLVVEQKVDPEKDNFGIRPLPNLETKFVAANTLIGFEKQGTLGSSEIKKMEQEIKGVRHRIFSAKTPLTKKKLRDKDQLLRKQMGDQLITEGWPNETARQLAGWDPYDQNASSAFFDNEWMFGVGDGFDVVIGNPPYISHDAIPNKKYLKDNYVAYEAFADILCFFFERGLELLQIGGTISYITSNSYLRSDYAKPIRDFIVKTGRVSKVINLPESRVFESAVVDTAITEVSLVDSDKPAYIVNSSLDSTNFEEFIHANSYQIPQVIFNKKVWGLLPEQITNIQEIMEYYPSLEQLGTKIRLGIATGNNDAFLIDSIQRKQLINKNPKNSEIIKPVLRGKDIQRYAYTQPDLYVLLTKNGIDVKGSYPEIYNYLDSFGEKFKNRGAKGNHWSNLRACAFFDDFKKSKIIWIELTNSGKFALCDDEKYLLNSAYFLLPPGGINIKFLLSVLNSKAIGFYIKTIAATSGMGTLRWINNYVKEFPIPDISKEKQEVYNPLVDITVYCKNAENIHMQNNFDSVTDAIIFQLYFPDHMQEKQIDILQFVEEDLAEVLQNRNFDKSPDNEKEEIIEELHARWTHPDSEVRNRIKLFAVRSPDILKPILESS